MRLGQLHPGAGRQPQALAVEPWPVREQHLLHDEPHELRCGDGCGGKLKEIAAKDLGGKAEDYDIDGTKVFAKSSPSKSLTYAAAAQRAIELGGKYSGKEMPEDINPITKASVTALAGTGLIGVAKDNLPVGGRSRPHS